MTAKKAKKKAVKRAPCGAEGCEAKAIPEQDLCERHQRMAEAEPCELDHCDRPSYAKGLCEAHYRRKQRGSEKWDGPILEPGTRSDLVFIATRVTPEVKQALENTFEPSQKMYGKLAEIVDEWLRRRGLAPSSQQHAA